MSYCDEDAYAIYALAQPGTRLYSDLILPSGRILPADEGNRLIAAVLVEREAQLAEDHEFACHRNYDSE